MILSVDTSPLQIAENTPENTLPAIKTSKISEEFSQFRNEMYSISDAMHVIKHEIDKNEETKNVNKITIEPGETEIENVIKKENVQEKEKDIEQVIEMNNENKEIKKEENIMKMKVEKEMEKAAAKENEKENVKELAEEDEDDDDEDLVLERFEFPLGSVIATVEMMFVAEEVYMTHTSGMGMYG